MLSMSDCTPPCCLVDRRQPQFAPHSRSQTHFGSEQDVLFACEPTLGTKTNESISHRSVSDYASDAQIGLVGKCNGQAHTLTDMEIGAILVVKERCSGTTPKPKEAG